VKSCSTLSNNLQSASTETLKFETAPSRILNYSGFGPVIEKFYPKTDQRPTAREMYSFTLSSAWALDIDGGHYQPSASLAPEQTL